MELSVVIITHNRCEPLRRTLEALAADSVAADPQRCEILVVDNGSTDGTAEAIARLHPHVRLIALPDNVGTQARNIGAEHAAGRLILFLDDDSRPLGETVERAIDSLDSRPDLAVVTGRITLPDGTGDAAALPLVCPAGALLIRRHVFQAVGGFSADLFLAAEEYDLAFRLLANGWAVERFEDLTFYHEKTSIARDSARICQLDLRNNLILAGRYLPGPWRRIYRRDWLQRYVALARHNNCEDVIPDAIASARRCLRGCDGLPGNRRDSTHLPAESRQILDESMLEAFFELQGQADAVAAWADENSIRRVVIADLSKNIYATWRACRLAGLVIDAIADSNPAFAGLTYRGVAVQPAEQALSRSSVDGVILSTINPGRIDDRLAALGTRFDAPILRLWHPRTLADRPAALP